MISLTVSEASRQFTDLVRRVCASDEEALISDNGTPVVRLVPVTTGPVTGKSLHDAWVQMGRLGADEATAMESDLAAARGSLKQPASQWD